MRAPFLSKQPKSPFLYADYEIWVATTGTWERKQTSTREKDPDKAMKIAQKLADTAHAAYMAANGGWSLPKAALLVNGILQSAGLPTAMVQRPAWVVYSAQWLAELRPTVKPRTLEIREGQLKMFTDWLGLRAGQPMDLLQQQDLQKFWGALADKYSGANPRNTMNAVKSVFKQAVNEGLLTKNPVALVRRKLAGKPLKSAQREAYTVGETLRVLSVARDWQGKGGGDWLTLVLLGLCTAARLGDCQAMGSQHALKTGKDYTLCFSDGKTGKDQVVPVVEPLLSHLLPLIKRGGVFCPRLADWRISDLGKTFNQVLDAAGIAPAIQIAGRQRKFRALTFHSLRHTTTSSLMAAGVDKDLRKAIVGHKSDAVHEGYTHVEDQQKRTALTGGLAKFTGKTAGKKKPVASVKTPRAG